ncbi:MAG: response regulator transcription factor [Coriobacteriia bacterium]|nr:response regulator transcription factor [Coriobacteriia bacterium]
MDAATATVTTATTATTAAAKRIYIADDETNIREAIQTFLENDGYEVCAFATGDALLEQFQADPADLCILDVMMPGSNGFTICKEIRKISTVPIIMLTARDSDLDYATGLSLGSDDYFTKPFSAMALVMRVKAIFRRIEFDTAQAAASARVRPQPQTLGDLMVDPGNKTAEVKGRQIDLTPNEFNLLCYLMENSEAAISRAELLESLWGFGSEVETRAVDDTVRRLRKKIAGSTVSVDTVWGYGFRLKVKDAPHDKITPGVILSEEEADHA